jgi:type IV secretion system protein VirB4
MHIDPESLVAKFVPYSTHVHPNVLRTVEGDYMVCFQLHGIPFLGREPQELEHKHNNFNKLLQTLRAPDYTNFSYWAHDIRRKRNVLTHKNYTGKFNQLLNDHYVQQLNSNSMLINELYFTLIYRPRGISTATERFFSGSLEGLELEQKEHISTVLEMANLLESTLYAYSPRRLGTYTSDQGGLFSSALEFLGYIINRIDEPIPVLPSRIFNYLPTSRHIFNEKTGNFLIETANGTRHFGAMLALRDYPEETYPGVLNSIKEVPFEYVMTHSFTPSGRQQALSYLERTKGRMLVTNDKAVSQIRDLDSAMDGLASGRFVLGEYHSTIALYDSKLQTLDSSVSQIRAILSNAAFVTSREQLASMASFYAQLPANWKYRTRKAYITSLNFLGLSPLHNYPVGKSQNNPWGPAVTVLQTTNGQPYYFNFHATKPHENSLGEKALGNTMVIGKSGTGKTALVNFLLSQIQKEGASPTIFFFDKDRGAEIFVRACAGRYMAIESGKPTGFNPLQCEATEENTLFLVMFIKLLSGKREFSSSEDDDILRAVKSILDIPINLRTMTNLQSSFPNLGDDSIYSRLKKWTRTGYLGWVFDNPKDSIVLDDANIIGFDYTELIDFPEVRAPVINYLIYRMEQLLDGRPFIYVMDEFWKILDGEGGLKEFARNKLKTIRKQNGLGIFATQSPEDALKSDISAALVEQTATLILLPNPSAEESDYVNGLKISKNEFNNIKSLDERSRCFFIKQNNDTAFCQLKLGGRPDLLAFISSNSQNIEKLHHLLKRHVNSDSDQYLKDPYRPIHPDLWLEEFIALVK